MSINWGIDFRDLAEDYPEIRRNPRHIRCWHKDSILTEIARIRKFKDRCDNMEQVHAILMNELLLRISLRPKKHERQQFEIKRSMRSQEIKTFQFKKVA